MLIIVLIYIPPLPSFLQADFRKHIVSLGKAVTIGHQERDEVILWTWQRAGQGTGAIRFMWKGLGTV